MSRAYLAAVGQKAASLVAEPALDWGLRTSVAEICPLSTMINCLIIQRCEVMMMMTMPEAAILSGRLQH